MLQSHSHFFFFCPPEICQPITLTSNIYSLALPGNGGNLCYSATLQLIRERCRHFSLTYLHTTMPAMNISIIHPRAFAGQPGTGRLGWSTTTTNKDQPTEARRGEAVKALPHRKALSSWVRSVACSSRFLLWPVFGSVIATSKMTRFLILRCSMCFERGQSWGCILWK